MNGFRPLRNDFVSASDQNTAKFTSKKIRCFGRKVHGKLRLRGRIRSSSQSIKEGKIHVLRDWVSTCITNKQQKHSFVVVYLI